MFFGNPNIIRRGLVQGAYNFSMQKAPFIPLVSNLGRDSLSAFFGEHMRGFTGGGYYEKANPYFVGTLSSWNADAASAEAGYIQAMLNFHENVDKLATRNYHFSQTRMDNFASRTWSKRLQKVSYHRFQTGRGKQVVNGVTYDMPVRSLGFLAQIDEQPTDLFYAFTFKTEYIEYLQQALYKGKPFNNAWFTLFLNPNIPNISKEGQFTKPFSRDFITPFEETGIEIVFNDSILDFLSFRSFEEKIEVPYVYKLDTKGRKNQQIEREEAMAKFISIKVDRITQQENWDMGIHSYERAIEQLRMYKELAGLRIFTAYIEDNFYGSKPKINGLQRELYTDGNHINQVWQEPSQSWIPYNEFPGTVNDLSMSFTLSGIPNRSMTPDVIDKAFINVEYRIHGGTKFAYTEEWVTYGLGTSEIYEILDYRAIYHSLSTLPSTVTSIRDLQRGELLNKQTFWYQHHSGLASLIWQDIHHLPAPDIHLMLSSDYAFSEHNVANNSFIYFADENNLYFKLENLLFSLNISASIDYDEAANILVRKNLIGEPNLKALFLNKVAGKSIFRGAQISHLLDSNVPFGTPYSPEDSNILTPNYGDTVTYTNPSTEFTFNEDSSTRITGIRETTSAIDLRRVNPVPPEAAFPFNPLIGEMRVNENAVETEVWNGTTWITQQEATNQGILILISDTVAEMRGQQIRESDSVTITREFDTEDEAALAELDLEAELEAHTSARIEDEAADAEDARMDEDSNIQYEESQIEEAASIEARDAALTSERLAPTTVEAEEESDEPDGSIFDETPITISDTDSTQGEPNEAPYGDEDGDVHIEQRGYES